MSAKDVPNEHETVSAKQKRIVVSVSAGVSPEGLSRTSVVQLQAGIAKANRAYTTRFGRNDAISSQVFGIKAELE